MKMFVVFFAVVVVAISKGTGFDTTRSSFVRNYFNDRHIQQIVVFACWDADDRLKFARDVMQLDTRVSYAEILLDMDMTNILRVNYYHIGVVLDYDCPRSEIVFEQFSQHRLPFNESYHWLVLANFSTIPTGVFSHLPLSVETEMTFAKRRENFSYVLHDVYNPSYRHNGPLNVTFKGVWTLQDGLKDELTQYKYVRRGNFHGLPLNFSIVLMNPALPDLETYITTPINRHLDTMMRYHYALVLQLRNIYNFTINLRRAKDWGYLINGTWNGILAEMIEGVVDISAAPFQYKLERMDVCEFTVESYTVKVRVIFRHPKKNTVRNAFLKPFVREVWYATVFIGLLYYLFLLITSKYEKSFYDEETNNYGQLASEIGLSTMASVFQQGLMDTPRFVPGRIVFLSLLLWGLLLYQFYSASIVGELLAEPPRFITTVKDLADSNLESWAEEIPYNHDFFRHTTNPDALALYEKKMKPTKQRPNGSFTTADQGMNLMRKGGYTFNVDTATAYKIITDTFNDDEICDLQEVELIRSQVVSLVTAKKSPFKKMVIYGLRRMVQHGLTQALRKVWVTSRPQCPESHSSRPSPVQVEEFSPAIFMLLVGSGFSIVIMFIEYCHNYLRKRTISQLSTLEQMSESSIITKESPNQPLDLNDII